MFYLKLVKLRQKDAKMCIIEEKPADRQTADGESN